MEELKYIHIHDYDELKCNIENDVLEEVLMLLEGIDIDVLEFNLIGSYLDGSNRIDSDIDFKLYYRGDVKEYSIFNILSKKIEYEGIIVDINPHRIY